MRFLYTAFAADRLLGGGTDLTAAGLTAYLIGDGYTPDPAHTALSDVPSGARLASVALADLSCVGGALDAQDASWTIPAGAAGRYVRGILLVRTDTGGPVYWTDEEAGLPIALPEIQVTRRWRIPTLGIFRLG